MDQVSARARDWERANNVKGITSREGLIKSARRRRSRCASRSSHCLSARSLRFKDIPLAAMACDDGPVGWSTIQQRQRNEV